MMMRPESGLQFAPLIFVLLGLADCKLPPEKQAPASDAVQIPVPKASFRLTFGLKDREPQAWNGRLLLKEGQVVQVEPDLLREHNYQALEEPEFPNDYVRDGLSWVCSTRPAWMRDPSDFELELPSLLLRVWRNSGNAPLQLETDRGALQFRPGDIKAFQPALFLDGAVRIEVVPSVFSPVQMSTGQQDYPSVLVRQGGELWVSWQEYAEQTDSVYARKRVDGQWEEPIRLVEGVDVFRTALGEDASGRVWAIWSMQVEGNWDLYGRAFDGSSWTSLERLTQNKGPDIFHRVVRDSENRLWLVWQATLDGVSQIVGKQFDGSGGRRGFTSATVPRERGTIGGQPWQQEKTAQSRWVGMAMRAVATMSTSEGWIPVDGVQFGGWLLPNALRRTRLCPSMRKIGSG